MNKYDDYYDKVETNEIEFYKEIKIISNVFKNLIIKYNLDKLVDINANDDSIINQILILYCAFPPIAQYEIKNNIFKFFDKEGLLKYVMINIINNLQNKNIKLAKILITSTIQLGLIKDFKIINDKNIKIIMQNDKDFNFEIVKSNLLKNVSYSMCYDTVEAYLVLCKEDFDVCGIMTKSIIGTPFFHVSIAKNGYIEDYTQNIKMKIKDYVNLFGCEMVFLEKKEDLISHIKQLSYSDKEFVDAFGNQVCKYIIKKHMDKHINEN